MKPPAGSARGFTLIELLVVIALIAGLSAFLVGGLRENKAAVLQSAQATLANLVTVARTRAEASGCRVRLLIHADPTRPERFRRTIVLQQETLYHSEVFSITHGIVSLPESTVVLPYKQRVPAGLYENVAAWTKTHSGPEGDELHSSALSGAAISVAVQETTPELWDVVQFTPNNTMSKIGGDLVLATVRKRPPGSYANGESPVQAESPDVVRGISLGTYGVPIPVNTRSGF